jgi:hypothetical protein
MGIKPFTFIAGTRKISNPAYSLGPPTDSGAMMIASCPFNLKKSNILKTELVTPLI